MSSNARMFCDALAAARWHRANHLPLPIGLEDAMIRTRYLSFVKDIIDDECGTRLLFLDDSVASRLPGRAWQELVT